MADARGYRGAVAATAALLVLVACTGRGSSSDPSPEADGFHLAPRCPSPTPEAHKPSADSLNKLVSSLDLDYWQAADIGASARLSDGRLVWVFGDTVRRSGVEPPLVANSMLVSTGRCVAQLLDAEHGPVVPDVDANTVRWPMSIALGRTGGHDVLVVLCSRIRRGGQGSFDFTFLGTTAAVLTVEAGAAPQLDKVLDLTPDSTDPQQVNWGAAADVHGGWYYVYGTRLTGKAYDFGRELYVARAPVADPGDRKRWQFWDGSAWQPHVQRAVAVLPSQGGVSQTLSVDSVGNRFVAVSKKDGDVSDYVYEWTAPHPWGPWKPHKELHAPAGFDSGELEYAPLAHPEIPLASGHLLVSISRNTTDFAHLMKDPEVGRPLFAELHD